MTEEYRSADGRLLATVLRTGLMTGNGHRFVTAGDAVLQVGVLLAGKGAKLREHRHNDVERTTVGTAEVLFVVRGFVAISLPECERRPLIRIGNGDAVVIYPGTAHGVEMLVDSLVLEVKSGPYAGQSMDKTFTEDAHGSVRSTEETDAGAVSGAGA